VPGAIWRKGLALWALPLRRLRPARRFWDQRGALASLLGLQRASHTRAPDGAKVVLSDVVQSAVQSEDGHAVQVVVGLRTGVDRCRTR